MQHFRFRQFIVSTDINMFAYCSNNPIVFVDYTGNGFLSDLWDGICSIFNAIGDDIVVFVNSLEFEFGFGLGIGGNVEFEEIEYYNFDGERVCYEKYYPQIDPSSTVGFSLYVGYFGITINIGLNWEYFFDNIN